MSTTLRAVRVERDLLVPLDTRVTVNSPQRQVTEALAGIPGVGVSGGGSGGGARTVDTTPPTGTSIGFVVPSAPITGQRMWFEADQGLGSPADGDSITTWSDLSGNGLDLANTGGTDRPIWKSDPDGDGRPLVRFDGSDDFVKKTGMTEYTGTDLTLYLVMRFTRQGSAASNGVATLGRNASTDTGTNLCAALVTDLGYLAVIRGGVTKRTPAFQTIGDPNMFTGAPEYLWNLFAFRSSTSMGRGAISVWANNLFTSFDYGASAPAWGISDVSLGCRLSGGGGTPGNYLVCDVRAFGYYHAAHRDDQVKYMLQYLAYKWKAGAIL